MDRRSFLKVASGFAFLAAGTATGVSRMFAGTSLSLPESNLQDGRIPDTSGTMEYRSLSGLDLSAIGLGCLPMVGYYGGKKIPELMKGIGKGIRSFREGMNHAEKEMDGTGELERKE